MNWDRNRMGATGATGGVSTIVDDACHMIAEAFGSADYVMNNPALVASVVQALALREAARVLAEALRK